MSENTQTAVMDAVDTEAEDENTQKDKYLTFLLAAETYAIEIYYVTEIIGIQRITEVPDTPDFIKGVINLRGKVIPVIDVRIRFRLNEREYGDRTCIIVIDVNDTVVGLIVDEVSEVLDIPEGQIDPPPQTGKNTKSRYIKGIGKIEENVKIILDVSKLLNDDELKQINEVKEEE